MVKAYIMAVLQRFFFASTFSSTGAAMVEPDLGSSSCWAGPPASTLQAKLPS